MISAMESLEALLAEYRPEKSPFKSDLIIELEKSILEVTLSFQMSNLHSENKDISHKYCRTMNRKPESQEGSENKLFEEDHHEDGQSEKGSSKRHSNATSGKPSDTKGRALQFDITGLCALCFIDSCFSDNSSGMSR